MLDKAWEQALQLSALVLSVINGLILLRVHLRDRARLKVSPVHPDAYQWWFELPGGACDGVPTRLYGFLLYVSVANRGYRAVSLDEWRFVVKAENRRRNELSPLSLPEPTAKLGDHIKVYPVLGSTGTSHEAKMRVDPGDSVSGMAFFVYECRGGAEWSPQLIDGHALGQFVIHDVYGGRAKCTVRCRQRPLEEVRELCPGIDGVVDTVRQTRAG